MLAGNRYITAFTDAVAVVIKAFLIFNKHEHCIALPAADPKIVSAVIVSDIEGTFGLNMVFSIHIAVRLTTCFTSSLFLTVSLATGVTLCCNFVSNIVVATDGAGVGGITSCSTSRSGYNCLVIVASYLTHFITEVTGSVASVVVLVLARRSGITDGYGNNIFSLVCVDTNAFLSQFELCNTISQCLKVKGNDSAGKNFSIFSGHKEHTKLAGLVDHTVVRGHKSIYFSLIASAIFGINEQIAFCILTISI